MINNDEIITSADVVVIGGGAVGTAAAYFLTKAGLKVCLVERNDLGAGTSSAASAAALLQTKTSATKLALASRSLAMLDELHSQFEPSFEFEHTGSLLAACSEAELEVVKDMIAKLQTLGLDVRLIDGDETRAMMPVLGQAVIGASHSPNDAQINPLELVVAYASAARRLGAALCTFTEVTGIERNGRQILAVQTNKGRIKTETVINTAGVWSPQLARLVGLDLPLKPLKGEILVTEVMPPLLRGTLISAKYLLSKTSLETASGAQTPRRSVGVTLVQVAHGNFLVGSTREQADYDRRSTYAGISELSRQLLDIAPAVANIHIIRAYAGLRPITPDGLPIIGPAPELPGFIIASGHGGDGLILSAITGQMVTELVAGVADPAQLAPFAADRFAPEGETVEGKTPVKV
jgi:glycine/D-amino acid oxidase-like deaminating enzyme